MAVSPVTTKARRAVIRNDAPNFSVMQALQGVSITPISVIG